MLYFLEAATETPVPAEGSMLTPILMMVIMVAIFYFILIRPENKRKKEAQKERNDIDKKNYPPIFASSGTSTKIRIVGKIQLDRTKKTYGRCFCHYAYLKISPLRCRRD